MSSSKISWCNSPDHVWRPTRREFLYVGLLGSFGLGMADIFRLQAKSAGSGAVKAVRAQSVINNYLP